MNSTNPIKTGTAQGPGPALGLAIMAGVRSLAGGVFISAGVGRHPRRVRGDWELILVERGRLGLAVGGVAHDLGPGGWVLMPAHVEHDGTTDYPRDLRFLWIHFHPCGGRGGLRGAAGISRLELPRSGQLEEPGLVSSLLRRLIDHHASLRPDQLVEDLLLALALAELGASPVHASVGDDLAGRALRIIQARFRDALTTAGVARALGVGPDHLGRRFQACHGRSVMDAINHQRLNEAQRLLLLGGGSIADVARGAGFRQAQWLRRLFTRRHGIGPRAWRRLHARVFTNST